MHSAVVLAAGLSSRRGAFKPLLPLGDSTFIKTIMERMRAAGVGRFVVVTGWRATELAGHLVGMPDVVCVENPAYVTSGLRRSRAVLPRVTMPMPLRPRWGRRSW